MQQLNEKKKKLNRAAETEKAVAFKKAPHKKKRSGGARLPGPRGPSQAAITRCVLKQRLHFNRTKRWHFPDKC